MLRALSMLVFVFGEVALYFFIGLLLFVPGSQPGFTEWIVIAGVLSVGLVLHSIAGWLWCAAKLEDLELNEAANIGPSVQRRLWRERGRYALVSMTIGFVIVVAVFYVVLNLP